MTHYFLFYVHLCFAYRRVCVTVSGITSPRTGVTDSCELPCGCWERNLGPLEEQLVGLTIESSLQAKYTFFFFPRRGFSV